MDKEHKIRIELLIENQRDALKNNQFDFILYDKGGGGEFITNLINKYSPNYNYYFKHKMHTDINKCALNINHWNMLCVVIKGWDSYTDYHQEQKFNDDYYALDAYVNLGGRLMTRAHDIFADYMTPDNTYYLNYHASKYWQNYRVEVCKIKLMHHQVFTSGKQRHHCEGSWFSEEQALEVSTSLAMDDVLTKGYLEKIFNITDESFHKDLMGWHRKNLRLLDYK